MIQGFFRYGLFGGRGEADAQSLGGFADGATVLELARVDFKIFFAISLPSSTNMPETIVYKGVFEGGRGLFLFHPSSTSDHSAD